MIERCIGETVRCHKGGFKQPSANARYRRFLNLVIVGVPAAFVVVLNRISL